MPPRSYHVCAAVIASGYLVGALVPPLVVGVLWALGLALYPFRRSIRPFWVAMVVHLGWAVGYRRAGHVLGSGLIRWRCFFAMAGLAMLVGLTGSWLAIVPIAILNFLMWKRRPGYFF